MLVQEKREEKNSLAQPVRYIDRGTLPIYLTSIMLLPRTVRFFLDTRKREKKEDSDVRLDRTVKTQDGKNELNLSIYLLRLD